MEAIELDRRNFLVVYIVNRIISCVELDSRGKIDDITLEILKRELIFYSFFQGSCFQRT